MKKLSIILPVYNVEKYVEKCIRSIENQDVPQNEYEIIAIDDGSPDKSVSIIQKLQSEYSNIRLVHKANGGLSSARNYGLQYACGEYIWFIDSDDYIEPNILSVLLRTAYSEHLDLVAFSIVDVWPGNREFLFEKRRPYNQIISGEEYVQKYEIDISACFFLVKRDILVNHCLFFVEGIIHEDYEFTLRLFRYVQRMTFTKLRVYNYVHHSGSITTIKSPEQELKTIHSWQEILKREMEYFNDESAYSRYAMYHVNHHKYIALTSLLKAGLPICQKQIEYARFKEIGAFNIGKTKLNIVRKLRCVLYNANWLYYLLLCYFSIRHVSRK